MANKKTSEESAASALDGTELVRLTQGGNSVAATSLAIAGINRTKLTTDTTFYVRTNGNNSNTGLVNSAGGAFRDIQYAIDWVADRLDLGNHVVTIKIVDGDYAEEVTLRDYVGGAADFPDPDASSQTIIANAKVKIVGNTSDVTGVKITGIATPVNLRLLRAYNTRPVYLDFLTFQPGVDYDAIEVGYNSLLCLGTLNYGTGGANGYCIWAPYKSAIVFQRGDNLGSDITFGGSWSSFITAYDDAYLHMWEHSTISFTADADFAGGFLSIGERAKLIMRRLDEINLNGHTVTGLKWDVWQGGSIYYSLNVGGEQEPNTLPGDLPGSINGGGQFNNVTSNTPAVKTADYTLTHEDGLRQVYMNKASAVVTTLPNSFPPGWSTTVIQKGAGQVSFAAASGATVNALGGVLTIPGQYGTARLYVESNSDGASALWRLAVVTQAALAPGGSDTQVQFNDGGTAFGGDAGLTFNKTTNFLSSTGGLLVDNPSAANGTTLFSVKNSNIGGSPGISYTAVDGLSYFKIGQGGSGGGLAFKDFNDQSLLTIGTSAGGFTYGAYWTIQGTNNTSIGDLGPSNDNAINIGDATHNVKKICQYTAAYKPVAVASLPTGVEGMVAAVTDANTPVMGTTVTGGASANALVWYNGANWTVIGV